MTGGVVSASGTDLVIAGCALATVAGTVAVVLWRRSRASMRAFRNFLEDWHGVPDRIGVPGRKGVMERLSNVEADVSEVKGQLKPNGGTSFYDKVTQAVESNSQPAAVVNIHTDGKDKA